MFPLVRIDCHGNGVFARTRFSRLMKGAFIVPLLSLLLTACVTDAEFLAQNTSSALNAAESRGKFELNCPQVTSSILSQKIDEGLRAGYAWAEYTVGVRGCGKQVVYITVCRDQDNCNALAQTGRVLDSGP